MSSCYEVIAMQTASQTAWRALVKPYFQGITFEHILPYYACVVRYDYAHIIIMVPPPLKCNHIK